MSAVVPVRARFRAMKESDLEAVMAIEEAVYPFPWTRGNFLDSIRAGYSCWIVEVDARVAGYAVLLLAPGEAHLLNLSVASDRQGCGLGRSLLRHVTRVAHDHGAGLMVLEVRPSNEVARALYRSAGFEQLGVRRDYYPAESGREDALVLGVAT